MIHLYTQSNCSVGKIINEPSTSACSSAIKIYPIRESAYTTNETDVKKNSKEKDEKDFYKKTFRS